MSWIRDMLGSGAERIEVLAVMPDAVVRGGLEAIAARENWVLRFVPECVKAVEAVKRHPAAVIICERDLPQCDWRAALAFLAEQVPGCPIIMSAPDFDDRFWIEVMERGGYDVVSRPFSEVRLASLVKRAAEEGRMR
jgi:DNA-binding NtrC family response regulator